MKTLFYLRGQGIDYEIFADTYADAQAELRRICPKEEAFLKFVTQNHSCPKCNCHATECNAT